MKWYKRTIVFSIGLGLELLFAIVTAFLIRENKAWVESLALPYFAPTSPLVFALLGEVMYVLSALSLSAFTKQLSDLPRGILSILAEGITEIVFLLFFFKLTYEITSFFIATGCLIVSFSNLWQFAKKGIAASLLRLPIVQIKVYFWMLVYCVLMLNFT